MNKFNTLSILFMLVLQACGGGETGTGVIAKDISIGTITGFGSVYVNGVEYETTDSNFEVEEQEGSEDDLKVGQVVTVEGAVNADGTTGVATRISYADEVEGIVLSNDMLTTGSLNVMGQIVHVDSKFEFESTVAGIASADLIVAGNIVEVSGYSSGAGEIWATMIEVKAANHTDEEIELKGKIAALDDEAKTFMLGALSVDFSGASLETALANDLFVEVKSNSAPNVDAVLAATKVELENDGVREEESGDDGDEIELQGIITALSADGFDLNGRAVKVDGDTEFVNGTQGNLLLGTIVEVDGEVKDGVLVAEEIDFEQEGDIEIHALVDSKGENSLNLLGLTVAVDNNTTMIDEQDEGITPVRYFSLADIKQGDYVELLMYQDDTGNLIATHLRRDDAQGTDVMVRAKLEADILSTDVEFSLLSIRVINNGSTGTAGDEVEITGTYDGSALTIINMN